MECGIQRQRQRQTSTQTETDSVSVRRKRGCEGKNTKLSMLLKTQI